MRQCPLFECQAMIDSHLFACRKHWFMMARAERDTVYKAWEAWKAGRINGKELLATQERVVESVHARCS